MLLFESPDGAARAAHAGGFGGASRWADPGTKSYGTGAKTRSSSEASEPEGELRAASNGMAKV